MDLNTLEEIHLPDTAILYLQVTETAPEIIRPKHLSRFNRALRGAVKSVVPSKIVDDYMEHYNCRPPPLFMILVSVIEVCVSLCGHC